MNLGCDVGKTQEMSYNAVPLYINIWTQMFAIISINLRTLLGDSSNILKDSIVECLNMDYAVRWHG